ncbi:hypothetical protein PDESU_03332 [Pontiella desulfatans]|uniref:PcfJ-like protein n=1 Tax=Pontiella desulfatans TaxID=2750659 RepID=A0A6C2U4F1_PONDE|nr:PcfJ domain-containing protein [Pontiella desulfatans]VGO14763.1 hypothetical protein PDESU_03332 [Pontiella desulfatans]
MTFDHLKYAPLSASAVRRILQFDQDAGFGPDGNQQNRNRFYLYLTQRKSDVEIRTVAVKARKRHEQPVVKEVALASVDDPWIRIHDLGFVHMSGYSVDWSPEGVGPAKYWDYRGRWESEAYGLRCMWKIDAPVVNPELLKRTRRFRWSAWEPKNGHILDYLKVYTEHPEIELLAKNGLGHFCTKVSLLRKLKKDRGFRQFFTQNIDAIKYCRFNIPEITMAYNKGITLAHAQQIQEARRRFRGNGLPREIDPLKALRYIEQKKVTPWQFTGYLHNCQTLNMNLADTKVSFPKQFNARRRHVQDQIDVIRAEAKELRQKAEAKTKREMPKKIAAIAEQWSWLEKLRGSYRIVLPRSVKEFSAEGKALANCLGRGYAAKVARGEVLIVFVRERAAPDTAFVAVEYNLKRGVVTQCYGSKNSKPPKKVLEFMNRAFSNNSSLEEAA